MTASRPRRSTKLDPLDLASPREELRPPLLSVGSTPEVAHVRQKAWRRLSRRDESLMPKPFAVSDEWRPPTRP